MKAGLTNNDLDMRISKLEANFESLSNNKRQSGRLLFFIYTYLSRHPTSSIVMFVIASLIGLMSILNSNKELILMTIILLCGYAVGVFAEIIDTSNSKLNN